MVPKSTYSSSLPAGTPRANRVTRRPCTHRDQEKVGLFRNRLRDGMGHNLNLHRESACRLQRLLDRGFRLGFVRHRHHRDTGLRDARLFGGDLADGVAEELAVVEAQAGDAADKRSLNDVGRVENATQPDLDDGQVGRGLRHGDWHGQGHGSGAAFPVAAPAQQPIAHS